MNDGGHDIRMPPGYAAELIAVACLGGRHVGAHNAGYDLETHDHGRVEVKSCARRGKDMLEFIAKGSFTELCDHVVLVTTSGSTARTRAEVTRRGDEVVISSTSALSRGEAGVRAYLIASSHLDQVAVKHPRADGKVRWQVRDGECRELDLLS